MTFTATVTVTNGPSLGAAPTGTVTFTDGATTLGAVVLDASGQATFTTSALAVGTHTVTATYGGATGLAGSDASVDQVVANADSATTLTSSLNPSTFGQAVTFTATVTITNGPANGGPATTGTVTFTDGGDEPRRAGRHRRVRAGDVHDVGARRRHPRHRRQLQRRRPASTTSGAVLDQVVDGVADAGGPYAINEGDALTLDGTGSLAGPGATYSWDVNDDGTFGDATGATPDADVDRARSARSRRRLHPAYRHPATHRRAHVHGDHAADDRQRGPDRHARQRRAGRRGVDGDRHLQRPGRSVGEDFAALTYSYDFDDDGTFEVVDSASDSAVVPASFLPDGPATYTVHARVADDDGGSLDLTTDITVTNAAATATITGPSTATVGVPVTLKVGADDPSPGDMAGTFEFTVDWGDGSPIVTASGPADPPVTHTYTTAGTFTVMATVTDPDGATSDPLTFAITVAAAADHDHDDDDRHDHHAGSDHDDRADRPRIATTTTTATASTTTTVAPGPTTTAVGGTGLPRTGAASSNVLLVGLALLGAGTVLVVGTTRRRRNSAG